MNKLLRLSLLPVLLLAGTLLTGCVSSAPAVVVLGPPRPYYNSYYWSAPRTYYRPVLARPAPVRPRAIVVPPASRHYHARPQRGHVRY
ncbi:hypothetical protein [Hymenobacter sp. BT190]|uniref:hypothetical protein n=1 Tax=Hymenobacter sp. BT190 TaxID=2763505 RepID=UPI001650E2CD|nr:hypothetical protein [Hymenobacter sp. BT190]MBC6697647.1 hypothetical protein [Hymenobacter sp. BT190]